MNKYLIKGLKLGEHTPFILCMKQQFWILIGQQNCQ